MEHVHIYDEREVPRGKRGEVGCLTIGGEWGALRSMPVLVP